MLFSTSIAYFFLASKLAHINKASNASILEMSFYHINSSEFLVLTHNIPRIIISEGRNCENNVTILECKW
jgi:hypothetical protein